MTWRGHKTDHNAIRVSEAVQKRLAEEARWTTTPALANRWRWGTWVDTVVHHGPGHLGVSSQSYIGMPAWFLPWNRPQRRRRDVSRETS